MAGNKKSQSVSKSDLPKPFDWSDSLIVTVQKRAFKHAKTGALLARIVGAKSERGEVMQFINHISNMGFYGADIWWGYENFCRSDIDYFIACVELEDKGFYDSILDYKAQQALIALKGKDV